MSDAEEVARLRAALEAARARLGQVEALERSARMSAELHAARAGVRSAMLRDRDVLINDMRRSGSWLATAPARLAGGLARALLRPRSRALHLSALRETWRRDLAQPLRGRAGRLLRGLRLRRGAGAAGVASQAPVYERALEEGSALALSPRVLIIAELSIPQCAKYRVWQKKAAIEQLGVGCSVVGWPDLYAARSALQLASSVIFYRVPAYPSVLGLIAEARRLGLPTAWEVDDLIFDRALLAANRNLADLSPALQAQLLEGADLYGAAMRECDRGITSTAVLAEQMQAAAGFEVAVVENALDAETLEAAERIRALPRPPRAELVIVYGSGTKTHDHDFLEAAPALLALMRERPWVRLHIIGELRLPPEFAGLAGQVVRSPATGYTAYLELLGDADIAIAPLEPTLFNDAKSNIKFLEASVVGLPSVCSPRQTFAALIEDGRTGLLAEGNEAWLGALRRLADDAALRRRMAAAACEQVLRRYSPASVARLQVAPLLRGLREVPRRRRLRVLVVNVFLWPRSFGGATIVAEEMARRLHQSGAAEIVAFTTQARAGDPPDTLCRYDWDGIPVIGVVATGGDTIQEHDDPRIAHLFEDVLDAVRPDIVHFHAIQALGVGMLRACIRRGQPYIVTAHDAWFLCERMFMVTGEGRYCFQTRIDLKLCRRCIPGAEHLEQRMEMSRTVLEGARLVLAPSEGHRALLLANGLDPARTLVHPNGTRLPATPRPARRPGPLRFGYVGGNQKVKGLHVLRQALEGLRRPDWTLVVVDNTLSLGFRSMHVEDWAVAGRIEVVPAYDRDGMDEFFAGIDVLLFPSQWRESFGMTVREALARDVWVVATEGGQSEAIQHGVNGTVLPLTDDPAPLAAAILALLDAAEAFEGYRNPLRDQITGFDVQAESLLALLTEAARPLA